MSEERAAYTLPGPNNTTLTFRPTRVKHLQVTDWCPFCKKAKGYNGIILIGIDDPEAVDAPEICMCSLFMPVPRSQPMMTLTPAIPGVYSATVSVSEYNSLLSLFMARGDEITRLQQRIAQLVGDDEPLILDMPSRSDECGVAMVIDRGRAEPDLYIEVDDHKDEIARLQAMVKNTAHYLTAKKDIGELTPVENALLLELSQAMEGKAE